MQQRNIDRDVDNEEDIYTENRQKKNFTVIQRQTAFKTDKQNIESNRDQQMNEIDSRVKRCETSRSKELKKDNDYKQVLNRRKQVENRSKSVSTDIER